MGRLSAGTKLGNAAPICGDGFVRELGLVFLAFLVGIAVPGLTRAAKLDATATGTGAVGSEITYTVAFSPVSNVSGYDVTIRWDPNELEFRSASPLFGGFAAAPAPAGHQRSRVANVIPEPAGVAAGNLFRVTFVVQPGFANDGVADDFAVDADPVANGRGIAGPAGVIISLDNPRGVAFDGLTRVPESEGAALAAGLALALLASARCARGRRASRNRLRVRLPRSLLAVFAEEPGCRSCVDPPS